jgi:hypothetical protein
MANDTTEETEDKPKKRRGRGARTVYFNCSASRELPKPDANGKFAKDAPKVMCTISQMIAVKTPLDQEIALKEFGDNLKALVKGISSAKLDEDGSFTYKDMKFSISQNEIADGPFYVVKGTASAEKSVSVNIPAKSVKYSGTEWEGVFQGWNVVAHGLKACEIERASGKKVAFQKDELVFLQLDDPTDEAVTMAKANGKDRPPRPRFGGERPIIYRSALENATPVS